MVYNISVLRSFCQFKDIKNHKHYSYHGFHTKIKILDAKWRWQWCWWHRYVGDFMMVTDLRCWWQNHYVGDFVRYFGDFLSVLHRSPTSWIGHQHLKLVNDLVINLEMSRWTWKPWNHVGNRIGSPNSKLCYYIRTYISKLIFIGIREIGKWHLKFISTFQLQPGLSNCSETFWFQQNIPTSE